MATSIAATHQGGVQGAVAASANLNVHTDTIVGVWTLGHTQEHVPAESDTESFKDVYNNVEGESVIGTDERVKVHESEFKAGGKYRSIVKLFLQYEKSKPESWMIGTGWLIRPDLLITAGHCSFDWSHNLGRVTTVKAYIGYQGRHKLNDPAVEFRKGAFIAAPAEWLTVRGNKRYDISFIKLDKPFTGITPIRHEDTPVSGYLDLGVVGYPGDLNHSVTREKGAEMYEMYLKTRFNLNEANQNMLAYDIDTFGGNSGSPVFVRPGMASIGVHTYGGNPNSATVLGALGNIVHDFVHAIDTDKTATQSKISFVKVPSHRHHAVAGGVSQTAHAHTVKTPAHAGAESSGAESDTESFLPVFRRAITLATSPTAKKIFSAGSGLVLGNAGKKISTVAHVAIDALSKMADKQSNGELPSVLTESAAATDPHAAVAAAFTQSEHHEMVASAAMKEAALESFCKLSPEFIQESGFFEKMASHAAKILPVVKRVGPKILSAAAEPALKILLDELHQHNVKATGGTESGEVDEPAAPLPTISVDHTKLHSMENNHKEFYNHLVQAHHRAAQESGTESEEFGFGDIFGIVGKALPIAARGLGGLASLAFGESGELEQQESGAPGLEPLLDRAVVAHAAYHAALEIPAESLAEEGFFDVFHSIVKKVAPVVMKAAPIVLKNAIPIAGQILGGLAGGESTEVKGLSKKSGHRGHGQHAAETPKAVRPRKSVANLNDFVDQISTTVQQPPVPAVPAQAQGGSLSEIPLGSSSGLAPPVTAY